jgi:putative peptide zinc metalloprotease protein
VTAAGPSVNLVLGGAASLASLAVHQTFGRALLLQFATFNFLAVLTNLNPAMELDGYFLLMDWLEIPGLRRKALTFLRKREYVRCLRSRTWSREQRIYAIFAALVLVYMVVAVGETILLFHLYFGSGLQHVLGKSAGGPAAWIVGGALGCLFVLPLVQEVRAGKGR